MGRLWPQFTATTNRGGLISWIGTLTPTPMSDTYTVGFEYSVPFRPEIRVLAPDLVVRPESDGLPHVFGDGTLCVHTADEWHGRLIIAQTIVPWTSTWLYFYEVWRDTGYWIGKGTHPEWPKHKSYKHEVQSDWHKQSY
jgi:hypothetical protein